MTAPSRDDEPVTVRPRAVAEHPLSRTQRLIWSSQRLAPAVPLANMGKLHRFAGRIDAGRFVAAFDDVVRASDALRTIVLERPGAQPVARVLALPPAPTAVIDLPVDQLEDWCTARIAVPIDATACAYDSVLIRHHDDDWSWYLDLHHVVTDAFGSALVFDRVARRYAGEDGDVDLVQYYDRAIPTSVGDDERDRFWSSMVHDGPPISPYGPRGGRTTAVTRRPVPLHSDLMSGLAGPYRTISRELGLLGLAASAMAVLLHRSDGRADLTLGIPIHHRSGRDAQRVIGPMMELYPLRVRVASHESGRELFDRIHRDIISVLRTARPGESPDTAFDAVVNVLTARFGRLDEVPTTTTWLRSGHVDPAHALRVQVYDYGDGLQIELDVNEGLSADGAHDRLPDHFAAQFDWIVTEPDRPVGDVDLTTDEERRLVARVNPPGPDGDLRPVHLTIAERFAEAPDRVTAEFGDASITCRQLDEHADAYAAWLRSRHVGRGARVGIRMHRSIELLAAVHGVLRAGAAFVMLDPDDPAERHRAISDDAGLALVIDGSEELGIVPAGNAAPGEAHPHDATLLDDTAYVLYTSGSTGTPKGVPISHRGLADYLRFAEASYTTAGAFVMPLHSSLVFDLTITSLFLPQLVGGRTIVVPGAPLEALAAIAGRSDLTVLKATPSQLELLTRMIDRPLGLEIVIVGGEAFRTPVATAFAHRCTPGVRIFNEYGPTEAVVGCMIHEWDQQNDSGPDVPIGTACPGAEVAVLDPCGQPSLVGSWGELYVRRPGMADGYLGLPELSAERFAPVPALDDRPWYRTGDRVRFERGVLVYGGRGDDQLKVNGVRLEPGEIEAALVRHHAITNAVVRVWTPAARRLERCSRCGLGTDVPGVELDDGVCSVCRTFEEIEPQTRDWFGTPTDLDAIRIEARERSSGEFDCLHLLSGGKDSTYALYRLVAAGWRVHALTLDNGYISDGAKANISRTVADLGISHEFVTTEAMAEIFRDSLDRFANVCNGCYKAIYTLATARAHELGIPVIVTGLSRGQFFETRLVPHQFESGRFDPDAIDRTVMQARRAYHRTTDAVTRLLPEQHVFERGDLAVLDEIRYVDFYRYVDVELSEMYEFLEQRAPWVRPADTGRSTNCLINVVGIHVHRTERGYHNYAEPYSWDVRLGHKSRDEALEELDDPVDQAEIDRMLAEIGYQPKRIEVLTAWYQTTDGQPVDTAELRTHLRELLPSRSMPSAFVHVDALPLASSTKLDIAALPPPARSDAGSRRYLAPATPTEAVAADVWAAALGVDRVGRDDDFFDLGGSSLPALETIAAMEAAIGVELPDALVFQHRVLHDFAAAVDLLSGTVASPSHVPELVDGTRPLSPGEEAMLFEYRSDPTDTRYNVTRLYTVDDDIDIGRLREALDLVVTRHQPLHTAFDVARTELSPAAACALEPMPGGSIDEFSDRQRAVPFDLDRGPLVRVHHGPAPTGGTALLIGLHHICVDAGTFDLLWDELDAAYHGRPLADLGSTVAAHGAWQRSRWAPAIDHWTERLARDRSSAFVTLPAPAGPSDDGYLEIDAPVRTSELAAAASTTPFAASLAAAVSVLASYSRTGSVQIGITAATKDHPAAEPLIGYFLNTLPLGFDVGPETTFDGLDSAASSTVADVLPHRTLPLSEIVSRLRRLGHEPPDVSHMLAYERLAPTSWGGRSAHHRILASGTSVSDLTFFVQERGEALRLGLEYRGAVVDAQLATELLDRFSEAVRTIVDGRHRTVRSMAAGRAPTDLDGPDLPTDQSPVIARFDRIARTDPSRIAVIDVDGTGWNYGDVRRRALALADSARHSIPAPRRIGVCVGRSSRMVEAILAAQYAGAAYVPLDPASPDDRLATIVETAELDAVFVGADQQHRFADHPTILVDAAGRESPDESPDVPDPDSPAYLIFTSGSTGRPAGVEVTHRNLAASTSARTVFYGHDPDRFLLTSSIGFDSSLVGLAWPLSTGGTIVIPADDVVHDVERLARLITDRDVSHVLMVPSLYRAMLDRGSARLRRLRLVIVAGEACPASLVEAHHELIPGVELVNEYGPTEATVWASAHRCEPGDDPVPIGRPIAGTTLRIADAHGTPLPHGVPGELLISGPGVTAGHLGSARTGAFVELEGRRWYRTGDLVACGSGGDLVFLGRIDDQLNVGGVRIEPAEIEQALTDIDGVRDAVVVAGIVDGREILIAHVAVPGSSGVTLDLDTVRRHLAGRVLPAAIPRAVAVHEELPRTAHGKLDRRAAALLPVGAAPTSDTSAAVHEAPASTGRPTVALEAFVDVWRRVLGRPEAGADADFFALGGDSLAAVELVTALEALVGHEVPIATLLTAPTPATAHTALGGRPSDTTEGLAVVTMRPGTSAGPTVLLTAAWDDVQGYRDLADAFDPTVTVLAAVVTAIDGTLDRVDLVAERIAESIAPTRPDVVLGWSIGGVVAFEVGRRLATDGTPPLEIALIDTYFPGEQRHIWSNRWWKYKSMLRPGSIGAAFGELRTMAGRRIRAIAARLGRRLLVWAGESAGSPTGARATPGGIPFAAMDHQPDVCEVPVVLYAAKTTNPARTVDRWAGVAPNLRVVRLDGRHRGFDSIMGRERVGAIVAGLDGSLLGPTDGHARPQ